MTLAAIGLGGNLGDPQAAFDAAIERLGREPGVRVVTTSSTWRSAPWGRTDQPEFANAVVLVETARSPRELLTLLMREEKRAGRARGERWAPRTLDLDLLFVGDAVLDEPGLTLPHPRLAERSFVLEPLLEVAPDWRHPVTGDSVREMRDALRAHRRGRAWSARGSGVGMSQVTSLSPPSHATPTGRGRYVAVEGVIGVGKTTLARRLAKSFDSAILLEIVEENPLLARFYDDPEAYAFQTQIFFLLSRFRQQMELSQRDMFAQSVVADYIFAKDQIFATINLSEEELSLYRTIVPLLEARLVKPELVVYLQATVDVLLERIKRRGRAFEREISREYLETLAEAYNHFFFHYDETPLLIVNTNEMDLVGEGEDYGRLLKMIQEHTSGTQYVGR